MHNVRFGIGTAEITDLSACARARDELLAATAAEAEAVAAHADRLDALGFDSAREARDLAAR